MNHKCAVVMCAALALLGVGCEKLSKGAPARSVANMLLMSPGALAASTNRYIAERHKLEIVTRESELQKSWESAVAFCGTLQCEVVSSSITTRTGDSVPSGSITLRVAPEELNKLIAQIGKLGEVAEHTTEREDKTIVVVDTEAKIKNLTTFRDNLRAMLAKPSATVKDLVEIQEQLTDTQSELDSETAHRRILANETEKIAVEISFNVEASSRNAGGFAQIWRALRESGAILADSTASVITTIVTIVPWLVLIVPGVWLLMRAWKRLRARRNRTGSSPTSTPVG